MNSLNTCLGLYLNILEKRFFCESTKRKASAESYISSNTWRAWKADTNKKGDVKCYLVSSYDVLIENFRRFHKNSPNFSRKDFDEFHRGEVESFYERCCEKGAFPRAIGEDKYKDKYNGRAYNPYAKIIDLAYTHYCFPSEKNAGECDYKPKESHELRSCLHAPLDGTVLDFVRVFNNLGLIKIPDSLKIPKGGMGSIKSKCDYDQIQDFIRETVDRFDSTNFTTSKISPLAFDVY